MQGIPRGSRTNTNHSWQVSRGGRARTQSAGEGAEAGAHPRAPVPAPPRPNVRLAEWSRLGGTALGQFNRTPSPYTIMSRC